MVDSAVHIFVVVNIFYRGNSFMVVAVTVFVVISPIGGNSDGRWWKDWFLFLWW